MSRYEVCGGLGTGLVGGALLVVLPGIGWGLGFLVIGTLLIVHAVLGKRENKKSCQHLLSRVRRNSTK